jgi:hypothetical protein
MAAIRFATTNLSGLHAAGKAEDRQHGLLAATLESHLGPEFARLFADFNARDSDQCEWFVESKPHPIRVSELRDEGDQVAFQDLCRQMIEQVIDLSHKLDAQGRQGRMIAAMLRSAAVFPPEDLWVYRGTPLIVNWGYKRDVSTPVKSEGITGTVKIDPAPAPIDGPEAPPEPVLKAPFWRRRLFLPILLWLVFAGIVGWSYFNLLPPCGLRPPFKICCWTSNCPVQIDQTVFLQGSLLQRQVDHAELQRALSQQDCAVESKRAEIERLKRGTAR